MKFLEGSDINPSEPSFFSLQVIVELLFSDSRTNNNEGGMQKMELKSSFWKNLRQFSRASPIGSRHYFWLAALLILGFLVCATQSLAQAPSQVRTVVRQVLPSMVTIATYDAQGTQIGMGSGFLLSSDGYIATCYHVIDGAYSARVRLHSGDEHRVRGCLELDIEKDFAIIKIDAIALTAVKLGNSEYLDAGENVIALGAPLGLSDTVTTGIVSSIRPKNGYRVIQHTAHISRGSSGGPLLNVSGQVVGVNSFLLQGGQGLYFALPINYVRAAWVNTQGQDLVSLSQLTEAIQSEIEKIKEEMLVEAIEKLFTGYDDPDGLFSMVIRRDWQVQRSDKEYRGDETSVPQRIVTFMNHSPNAEKAKLGGWLSEGVRIQLFLPPEGQQWIMDWAQEWQSTSINNMLNGYSRHKATPVETVKFGNVYAQYIIVAGESPQISKKEVSILYNGIHPNCLMQIEMTMPADKTDELELVNTVVSSTFNAAWVE